MVRGVDTTLLKAVAVAGLQPFRALVCLAHAVNLTEKMRNLSESRDECSRRSITFRDGWHRGPPRFLTLTCVSLVAARLEKSSEGAFTQGLFPKVQARFDAFKVIFPSEEMEFDHCSHERGMGKSWFRLERWQLRQA